MLKPAILYKDQVRELYLKTWFDPRYMYYSINNGQGNFGLEEDNTNFHEFVSTDDDDNVLGVISYSVNYAVMQATSLGIIAFRMMSGTFMKDVCQAIEDIFFKYNMNRLAFYAVADNPAVRGYTRLVERFGGSIIGYEHESCKLIDGKLHDCILFEIMSKDFKSHHTHRSKSNKLSKGD